MSGRLVGSNMATAVKTIPVTTVGKNMCRSANILFLHNNPDAFYTTSQEHFKPFFVKKAEPVHHPTLAAPGPSDERYFKEDQSETKASYQHLLLPQITCTPRRVLHNTNIRMTDPREVIYLTSHAKEFQPLRCQRRAPVRPSETLKKQEQMLQSTETTTKVFFSPHRVCPVVKANPKLLECPPIKGDKLYHSFVSDYTKNFQGDQSRPAQSTKNHNTSVAMGDPVKIVDRETSYTGSFSWPPVCRPPEVKERRNLILGNCSDNSWLSTSKEAFCSPKQCPVVLIQQNRNFSSIPEGDTNENRNRERMSLTTNRVSFSDPTPKERPMYVSGAGLRAKTDVLFGEPRLSGLYYTTTANEHYSRWEGERAKPAVCLPSSILRGPGHGLSLSITQSDYVPQQISRLPPCVSLHKSNEWFPRGDKCFNTTYSEEYIHKPLVHHQPVHSRLANRLKIK